jgi:hypothetical protein
MHAAPPGMPCHFCISLRYSVCVLYSYKSTNTDAEGAARHALSFCTSFHVPSRRQTGGGGFRVASKRRDSARFRRTGRFLVVCARDSFFAARKHRFSPQDYCGESCARVLNLLALYWYKSTHTDTEGAARFRGPVIGVHVRNGDYCSFENENGGLCLMYR